MSGLLVLGAGGHAKVVADIILAQGFPLVGFLDDDPQTWGGKRLNYPVLGYIDTYAHYGADALALGIGDNQAREQVVQRLGVGHYFLHSAVHPSATISAYAWLGQGVVIAARAVINPDSELGHYAILNTGATVDHDCIIGEYAHLAPGTHLAGGVTVGRGALIGVGASVAPGCRIGEWAVIGAGAAVVCDIPDRVTAKGVPARW